MTVPFTLQHHFVDVIPDDLTDGHLYVCMVHATVVHRCCCGCGSEVVTPLAPNGWQLAFDGETVSLSPSIGNWSFACRSHYWIRNGRVVWARQWSDREVADARSDAVSVHASAEETRAHTPVKRGPFAWVRTALRRKWPTRCP